MMLAQSVRRLSQIAGFDFHVASTLMLRFWSLFAGAITILIVPSTLSPVEQGYYFTFLSILALQVFFDLGLNYVLTLKTAGEADKLHNDLEIYNANQTRAARARVGSLVALVLRVYSWLSVGFILVVGLGGYYFFSQKSPSESFWITSWFLLVCSTGISLFFSPLLAINEGLGRVGEVAQLRTAQSVIGYSATWLGLFCGLGLVSVTFLSLASILSCLIWVRSRGRPLLELAKEFKQNQSEAEGMSWRKEIAPLQWRMALSWASGYFIFQLFNPIVFSHYGPVMAGKVGLGLAIFNSIVTLSMSWVNAKSPAIARDLSMGQFSAARALFKRQFVASALANILMVGCVLISSWVFGRLGFDLSERLPSFPILACMAVNVLANQLVFSMAVYIRAFGREPLLFTSLVSSILTVGALATAQLNDLTLMMGLCAGVTVLITLPWVSILFKHYWSANSMAEI